MRRWTALLILAAAWTGAAGQEAKKDPPKAEVKKEEPKKEEARKAEEAPLYPLTIGSKWTYTVSGKMFDIVITAARKEKIGDVECTVLESTRDGKVVASEHVAIVGDAVTRYRFSKFEITPPLAFAKTGLKKGDKWNAAYSLIIEDEKTKEKEKLDTKVAYEVSEEKVKVPAGEYDAVLIVGKLGGTEAKAKEEPKYDGETKLWLARGVGPVKMYFDLGEEKTTLELKSADVKK